MTQQDIINIASQYHGKPMSKKEIYSMYPTEEAFMYAMGGHIDAYKSGGSIHIKPSKRGTFTAAAKKHGKSVQGFASQVLANKGNYSPAMVKKANFARNAAKWKHEDGGEIMYGHGGTVDVLQLMGMPTPRMYAAGGPYIPPFSDALEGSNPVDYNTVLANASPVFNPIPPQNQTPIKFVERKPANTVNYNVEYNNNLDKLTPEQALKINAAYNHNFKNGVIIGAEGNYNINRVYPQESTSPIINQGWNAGVNAGYTGRNSTITGGASYNPESGISGNIKGTWNFGGRHANGGSILPHMYALGTMVDGGIDGNGDTTPQGTKQQPRIVQSVPQGYTLVPGTTSTYMMSTPGTSSITPRPVTNTNTVRHVNTGNVVRHTPSVNRQSTPGMEDYVTLREDIQPMTPKGPEVNMDLPDYMMPRLKRQTYHYSDDWSDMYGGHKGGYNKRSGQKEGGGFNLPHCDGPDCFKFANGGHITHYIPSYNFGHVQSANNTYRHGYANGGNVYPQANNYNNWLISPNYMNSQIPMHAKGGFLGELGNTLYDSALLGIDSAASVFGGKDIIGDKRYADDTLFGDNSNTFTDASHWTGETLEAVAPTVVNFVPGLGPVASAALSGIQAGVGAVTPVDEDRLMSKSGQDAAKLGIGLKLAGAATTLGVNAANAGKAGADVAKTASTAKTMKTIADVGKAAKYAGNTIDIYNTAKDPNADWKDWAAVGLSTAGNVGGDLAGAGQAGLNQSVKNLGFSTGSKNPYSSIQALKDMSKYSNLGAAGTQLGNAARAGRASMSLYNTGENIDKYGLNTQTGLQAMNAVGQGIGATAGYSDNQNLQDFSKYYNTAANTANFGYNTYNTINSGVNDILPYMQLLPQGISTGIQLSDTFSNQRPGQFVPSSLGKNAMGGAVNAPNMMKYASGGTTGYDIYDLAQLSKENNLMDNSRLLGYNLVGTDKFAEGGNPEMTMGNVEKGELLLNGDGKIVTKYMGGGMVPHPADGSQDPNGNVPLQQGQFIIPKRYAKSYEAAINNNDKLYADSIKNTTEIVKAKKEAEEQAQQEAMQQKAYKAYDRFVAKYGGHVPGLNMYGKGAKVKPDPDPNINKDLMQRKGESWDDYQQRILLQDPKELKRMQGIYTPEEMTKWNITVPGMTESDYLDYVNNQTPMAGYNRGIENAKKAFTEQQKTYMDNLTPVADAPVTFNNPYIVDKQAREIAKNKRINAAIMAGTLAPVAYNALSTLFAKDAKLTTEDVTPLQWTDLSGDAARRALKSAYATAKYNIPVGSGYLAERTKRAADYMEATSKLEQDLANMNAQGRMSVAEKNAAIDAANKDRRAQAKMFEMQTKAARQGAMSTAFSQLGQVADAYRQQKAYEQGVYPAMSTAFKNIGGKWYFTDPSSGTTTEVK